MGLGKTLQASAIVASDIAEWRASNNGKELLSLIICPSTLVGHWAYEIEKYIDASVMTPLQYVGSAHDRTALRNRFEKYNVIITSYDIIRKDIDYLRQLAWNYCILDEGHIIKNSKSKITVAVKQLKAEHRLVLSGTPIQVGWHPSCITVGNPDCSSLLMIYFKCVFQNNVLELWSLFDFLMPGFLGTERQVTWDIYTCVVLAVLPYYLYCGFWILLVNGVLTFCYNFLLVEIQMCRRNAWIFSFP